MRPTDFTDYTDASEPRRSKAATKSGTGPALKDRYPRSEVFQTGPVSLFCGSLPSGERGRFIREIRVIRRIFNSDLSSAAWRTTRPKASRDAIC